MQTKKRTKQCDKKCKYFENHCCIYGSGKVKFLIDPLGKPKDCKLIEKG